MIALEAEIELPNGEVCTNLDAEVERRRRMGERSLRAAALPRAGLNVQEVGDPEHSRRLRKDKTGWEGVSFTT